MANLTYAGFNPDLICPSCGQGLDVDDLNIDPQQCDDEENCPQCGSFIIISEAVA